MGKSSTTTEQSPWTPQADFLQNTVMPFAKNISQTPFTEFGGDRVAGANDLQQQAIAGYGGLDMGADQYAAAGNVYSGLANRTPEDQAAQISQYQNQFTSGVIDPTFQGERAGEYDARMGQTLAGLHQQGLQYGTQRAGAEDTMRMQAAGSMASNAGSAMQSQMAGLGSQLAAGETMRGLSQADLDAEYENYMLKMQYPLTQLTALTGGAAVLPNYAGTSTQTKDAGLGGTLTALGSFGQGYGAMFP